MSYSSHTLAELGFRLVASTVASRFVRLSDQRFARVSALTWPCPFSMHKYQTTDHTLPWSTYRAVHSHASMPHTHQSVEPALPPARPCLTHPSTLSTWLPRLSARQASHPSLP